ncbi:MAG: penicillin-binding protein 1A [Rickettsiella sp.]|nr:penicillin-binding protein 1A [Rickettsiella sp.]
MKQRFRLLRNLLLMLLSLFITLIVMVGFLYLYLDKQLPDVDELRSVQLPIPMKIYTSDGQPIAEFGELHRNLVRLNEVPTLMVKAFLATEDQRFLEHHGVDFYGLLRAAGELLLTGNKVQGGSTITMQVARNFYLSREKTFLRKFTEILLSLKIEREFTKDQILELYLNKIFLGNRAYGISAAAQVYFDKTLNQLTLPEMATIAGLPKAPSAINPLVNPIAAKQRRDHVLARMLELGYISKSVYKAAIETPMLTHPDTEIEGMIKAPYVAEMVRDMMYKSFGDDIYTKGYNVYTTLNTAQQIAANKALRKALLAYDRRHGYRGPEKNIGPLDAAKLTHALNALHRISSVNDLQAALVTLITDQGILALLANNQSILIPWEGLAWTVPQLDVTQINPLPEALREKVHLGDIIRVQKHNNAWQLTQIPKVQGALVALNPQNGAITALVGGFDYNLSKFNRVIQAERQPGSGFKPFIYAAALAKGYTLANVFNDAPLVFDIPGRDEPWRPQNDNHIFSGPTRLRVALAKSINLVSIRLLQAIDIPYVLAYVKRFGFNPKKLPHNLSLALGTGEVTPIELARGYAVFANGGYRVTPYLIDHITDEQNEIIYQAEPKIACEECLTGKIEAPSPNAKDSPFAPQAVPADIAFLMTSALKDVIRYGTGSLARSLGRHDLAGKTGTTSDYVDTWFTGFNSDLVATVWIGFDQPSSVLEYGSKAALPMWIDFMRVALQGKPERTMPQPPDIITASIDPMTGYLLPEGSPGSILEYFRKDNLPKIPVDEDTNQLENSSVEQINTDNAEKEEIQINQTNEPLF